MDWRRRKNVRKASRIGRIPIAKRVWKMGGRMRREMIVLIVRESVEV